MGGSLKIGHHIFISDIVELQHLLGAVVHLVVQDGHEQMLHIHSLGMLHTGLKHSQFENVAGLLVQHQLACIQRFLDIVHPNAFLKFVLYGLYIDFHTTEQVSYHTVLLSDDTQQQMLRPHAPACQPRGLLSAESEDF